MEWFFGLCDRHTPDTQTHTITHTHTGTVRRRQPKNSERKRNSSKKREKKRERKRESAKKKERSMREAAFPPKKRALCSLTHNLSRNLRPHLVHRHKHTVCHSRVHMCTGPLALPLPLALRLRDLLPLSLPRVPLALPLFAPEQHLSPSHERTHMHSLTVKGNGKAKDRGKARVVTIQYPNQMAL